MKNLPEIPSLLKRAAEKSGLDRIRFIEKNIPNNATDISVLLLFPDFRSMMIISSLFMKRYKEEVKTSKYLIVISYPGFENLLPSADEYWTINDDDLLKKIYSSAKPFENNSDYLLSIIRVLNQHFYELNQADFFKSYYNNGLTSEYLEKFKDVKRFLPLLPSSTSIGKDFNRDLNKKGGYKIFINPTHSINQWESGRITKLPISREFWVEFCRVLLERGYCPVLWKTQFSHDLTSEFADSCIHLAENDMLKVLAAMRACHAVLDLFSDMSRYAILARCPFLMCDERQRFFNQKEYEIDDLLGRGTFKKYFYTFTSHTQLSSKSYWKILLYDGIVNELDLFIPKVDKDGLVSASEFNDIVSYNSVRKFQSKKLGTKFIKRALKEQEDF